MNSSIEKRLFDLKKEQKKLILEIKDETNSKEYLNSKLSELELKVAYLLKDILVYE